MSLYQFGCCLSRFSLLYCTWDCSLSLCPKDFPPSASAGIGLTLRGTVLYLDVPHVRKICAVHAVEVFARRRILLESMYCMRHESIRAALLANELNILLHSFCHSRAQTFENDLQACKPLVQILSLMRQRIWIPSPRIALPLLNNPTELESESQCAVLYCTRMEKLGTTSHGQTA